MRETYITVSGAGGVINFEMKIIEDALKAAGYKVNVINDCANWVCSSEEGWHDRVAKSIKEREEVITLKANHIPWGG